VPICRIPGMAAQRRSTVSARASDHCGLRSPSRRRRVAKRLCGAGNSNDPADSRRNPASAASSTSSHAAKCTWGAYVGASSGSGSTARSIGTGHITLRNARTRGRSRPASRSAHVSGSRSGEISGISAALFVVRTTCPPGRADPAHLAQAGIGVDEVLDDLAEHDDVGHRVAQRDGLDDGLGQDGGVGTLQTVVDAVSGRGRSRRGGSGPPCRPGRGRAPRRSRRRRRCRPAHAPFHLPCHRGVPELVLAPVVCRPVLELALHGADALDVEPRQHVGPQASQPGEVVVELGAADAPADRVGLANPAVATAPRAAAVRR